MATDLNYVGVPSAGLQFGTLVTTGTAGPSNTDDYNGYVVYDAAGNALPPGTPIPPGTQISIGYPAKTPSQTGGDVVTGTDILDQAERIRASQDASRIAQEQINVQREQLAQQAAQADRLFQQSQQDNQRRYELDKSIFGEQVAMRLFNERMAEASAKRDETRLAMEQQSQRFQMADTLAGRKLDIMNMLAERSGPQDWVAYNNLLNGFQGPEAQSSQTIDVFDTVKDLERQIAGLQSGNTGAGGGPTVRPQTPSPAPQAGQAPPSQAPIWQTPGGQTQGPPGTGPVNRTMPIEGAPMPVQDDGTRNGRNPGNAWASANVSGTGQGAFDMRGLLDKVRGAGSIPGMEQGGAANTPMVLTGESSSGRQNPEIVMNPTRAPMAVIPVAKLLASMPHAESGGVYNVGEQLGTGKYTYNTYSPQDLGNQPFIRKLRGEQESNPWSGFGARLQNRRLGINGMPDTINVRNYLNLAPTEQAMTQDLYQRGLGVDFGDILERSRRAAPMGSSLPVSTYGR